jgi:hypothetical protein
VALPVVVRAALAAAAVSLPPGPAAALCAVHLRRSTLAGAAAALGAAPRALEYPALLLAGSAGILGSTLR